MVSATRLRDLFIVIGAPALVGAFLGVSAGASALVEGALGLPAAFIGVGLLMAPALYIAAAFLGVAPSASVVTRAAAASLKDAGIIMLGLAPAIGFLVATTHQGHTVLALTHVVVGLTALLTLAALYRRLFGPAAERATATGDRLAAEVEAGAPGGAGEPVTAWQGPRLKVPLLFFAWSVVTLGLGWRLLLTVFAA